MIPCQKLLTQEGTARACNNLWLWMIVACSDRCHPYILLQILTLAAIVYNTQRLPYAIDHTPT